MEYGRPSWPQPTYESRIAGGHEAWVDLTGVPVAGCPIYPGATSQKFTADSYVYEILCALCRFMWEYSVRAVGKFSLSPTLTGLSSSLLSFTS